jgi:hypothetical protein
VMEEFTARADAGEVATLTRIVSRGPQMRTLTKDALFACVESLSSSTCWLLRTSRDN